MKNRKSYRRLVPRLLCALFILIAVAAPIIQMPTKALATSWWDDDWDYRNILSFNASTISENLTNFPVLVSLNVTNFDFSLAKSAGADIRFVDKDDTTPLDYEIESWTDNTSAVIWVEIPRIDASSNYSDYFYIYYGNAAASDDQDVTGTWDANYVMVQHMDDVTTSTVVDSTSSNITGTKTGANNPIQATGKIGNGQSYNGTNSNVLLTGNPAPLRISGNITISAWMNVTDHTARRPVIDLSYNYLTGLALLDDTNGSLTGQFKGVIFDYGMTVADGVWSFGAFVSNGATYSKVYVNTGSYQRADFIPAYSTTYTYGIGYQYYNTYWFKGGMDEVRVSNVVRSANWLKAEYMSGANTLLYYGNTDPPPTMSTQAATGVTMTKDAVTGGTFNGSLDHLGGAPSVDVCFQWGDDNITYGNYTANQTLTNIQAFTAAIPAGLTPGATYHVRAVGTNVDGVGYGEDQIFTFSMPTITSLAAGSITMDKDGDTSVTFSGNVTSLGAASTFYDFFQCGLTTSYGTNTTAASGNATGTYNLVMGTDLTPGATYHVRAAVRVGSVYVYGSDQSWTFTMPTVSTSAISGLSTAATTAATLNGSLSDMGVASSAYTYFEYGSSTSYGTSTTTTTALVPAALARPVTGFSFGITLHARAVAQVGSVKVYGADQSVDVPYFSDSLVGLTPVVLVSPVILFMIMILSTVYFGVRAIKRNEDRIINVVLSALSLVLLIWLFSALVTAFASLLFG